MGKLGYAIGKGLQEAGAQWQGIIAKKEEQKRYDEQLEMKQKQQEANLRSMDIRNEQLTLANNLKRVELNNKRITTVFSQTEGDPAATSKAITQYGSGHAERYMEAESREATKANGFETIITENGVFETNDEGKVIPGKDGKPIFKRFNGGAGVITRTRAEYNDHVGRVLNPNMALANITANQTYKDIYAKNEAMLKAKEASAERQAQTPEGKLKARGLEADVKIKEKEAAGLTDKPAAMTVQNIQGKDVKRTHTEAQGDLASMKIIAKDHPEWGVTSPDQAYRINELKNNAEMRTAIADDVQKAIKDETYAQKFIVEGSKKLRVPEQMLRDMVNNASDNAEVIESKKGGFMNWLKEFLGGDDKAPERY